MTARTSGRRGVGPAAAFVVGPGLVVPGRTGGPLAGRTAAVKDVIDVVGVAAHLGTNDTGREPARCSASVVERLVDAGVDIVGTTVTDELAWSLFGTNPHWGTPLNAAVPGAVPGGSSSGSAAAVAVGAVDIGLGTDTGGSIRVPAAWCELIGFRPTHGRVDTAGVAHLAPSFDTVGWLVRDAPLARAVGSVLLDAPGERPGPLRRVVVAEDLIALADDDVAHAVRCAADRLAADLGTRVESAHVTRSVGGPTAVAEAFRVIQGAEALTVHGAWLATDPPLGPGVAGRVAAARRIRPEDIDAARHQRSTLVASLDELGRDVVVVAPSAPIPAPTAARLSEDPSIRSRVLATTATASLWGAPVLARPLAGRAGAGWSAMVAPTQDESLLDLL